MADELFTKKTVLTLVYIDKQKKTHGEDIEYKTLNDYLASDKCRFNASHFFPGAIHSKSESDADHNYVHHLDCTDDEKIKITEVMVKK